MSDQPTQELVTVRRGPLRTVVGLLILSVLASIALAVLLILNANNDASQSDLDQVRQVVCNGTVVIPDDRRVLDSHSADRLVKLCGKKGPAGQPGNPGNTGAIGPTGPPGQSGSSGKNGASGHTGAVGSTGAPGPQGKAGLPGPRGVRGRRGKAGKRGRDGTPAVGVQQINEQIHQLQETVTALSDTVDSVSNLLCRLLRCP